MTRDEGAAGQRRYARVKELFLEARSLAPQQRSAWLAERCGGDETLLAEINDLFRHDLSDAAFPEVPVLGAAFTPVPGTTATEIPAGVVSQVGPYRLVRRLGSGGMGAVWVAEQLGTGQRVALKLLGEHFLDAQIQRQRFEREVKLAARLQHPHIARVYDSGLSQGMYYYAMQLVEGEHLDRWVEIQQMDERRILSLMRQVCLAVHHAHARGVVHRDLKPSNILVTADGEPHLVDFGLACSVLPNDPRVTVEPQKGLVGTVAYMSPEQATGASEHVGAASDVFSLGVILFRLLAGEHPFDLSGSGFDILRRIIEGAPRRISDMRPLTITTVEAVLARAMARSLGERYAVAGELAADLESCLNGTPLAVPTLRLAQTAGVSSGTVGPLSPVTMVTRPAALPGLRSWTVETRALRGPTVIACSPDGKSLASVGGGWVDGDGTVRVIDANTLAVTRVLYGHKRWPTSVAWSPRGGLLATADIDGVALLWRTERGAVAHRLESRSSVHDVAWSPDGSLLATGHGDDTVRIWDTESGELIRSFRTGCGGVQQLAWSPLSQRELAVGGLDRTVTIWETVARKPLRSMPAHELGRIHGLDWSPDGKWLASTADDIGGADMHIVDMATGTLLGKHRFYRGGSFFVDWAPDSARLVVLDSYGVVVLHAREGKVQFQLKDFRPRSAAWHPDGLRVFVTDRIGTIRVLDPQTGRVMQQTSAAGDASTFAIAWSPDSSTVAVDGSSLDLVGVHGGTRRLIPPTTVGAVGVRPPAWSADGRRVSATGIQIRVWDASTGQLLHHLPPIHDATTWCLAWDPAGQYLATSQHENIVIRDYDTCVPKLTVEATRATHRAVVWHPTGRMLAGAATEGPVHVWNADDGKLIHRLNAGTTACRAVAWSPDGELLASGNEDAVVRLWDAGTGRLILDLRGHTNVISDVQFARDGARVLSVSEDRTLRIWDIESGRNVETLALPGPGILSPDGSLLCTDRLQLFDVASRSILRTLLPLDRGRMVAVSADGHFTGPNDASQSLVYIAQTAEGQEMLTPDEFATRFHWKNIPDRMAR